MLRSDRVTSVRARTRCQSLELWVQIGDREVERRTVKVEGGGGGVGAVRTMACGGGGGEAPSLC
jgi:hypothetical protein